MLQFLHPAYWIALAGLLVPILIHLWNRKKGKTIRVGSIELLREAEARHVSNIKLTNLWRLLLRMAIISCFAFFLMAPYWQGKTKLQNDNKWVLIGQEYLNHKDLPSIADSLQQLGYQLRLFKKGFPNLDNATDSIEIENYWSLLFDLKERQEPPDSVIILAHLTRPQFKGLRPAFDIPLKWISLPYSTSEFFIAKAWQQGTDLSLLIGESSGEGTLFHRHLIALEGNTGSYKIPEFPEIEIRLLQIENQRVVQFLNQHEEAVPILDSFQIQVSLVADDEFELDKQYLKAALRAVESYLEVPVVIHETLTPGQSDWLFYLSNQQLPDSLRIAFAPNLAIFQPRKTTEDLFFVETEGGYHLTKRIEQSHQNWILPHELIAIIFDKTLDRSLHDKDQRVLAISQVMPKLEGKQILPDKEAGQPSKALFFPIWLILLSLFVLERNL